MRRLADSVVISGILHTAALFFFVRAALWNYLAGSDKASFAKLDAGFQAASETAHYFGIACFAMIAIGLIVVWTGYVKRTRSAWLVMFVIVWFWVFPVFVRPFLAAVVRGRLGLSAPEALYHAVSEPGGLRLELEAELTFLLMVLALLLPIRKFFLASRVQKPTRQLSPTLVGFCLAGGLVVLSALYAWIRVGVVYEIPIAVMNMTDRLPPPPPPPGWAAPNGNTP